MSFSNEWEQRYAANTHLSVWPWSDVVSLVHRHCKPVISAGGGRVLELGCGAGANLPLFRALGINYFAVEGSPSIVKHLHARHPDLATQIVCGDFTRQQPFGDGFDLVLDRAALTHNNTKAITSALQLAYDALKPGGIFIGTDWFSTNYADFKIGDSVDDAFTRTNITSGSFAGVGKVHFSDEPHLRALFAHFEIIFLEEKLTQRHEPQDQHQFASWNIVARKPSV